MTAKPYVKSKAAVAPRLCPVYLRQQNITTQNSTENSHGKYAGDWKATKTMRDTIAVMLYVR